MSFEDGKSKEASLGFTDLNGVGRNDQPAAPVAKMSQRRILKNLVVVSFGFLFLFTSFSALSNLQSSLNKEEGLGVIGLSVIYAALVISCLFLPPFIIALLGCKWTIVFSMMCYILYMAANFYATWGTIIPSAIILGFGAAPLWSAKCTYLTETGVWFSRASGTGEDAIINRFFGFFFMTFQTSQIWGNLISSQIFSERQENTTLEFNNGTDSTNVTVFDTSVCGASFCPGDDETAEKLKKPELSQVYTVCGIYVCSAVLAVIIVAIGLDPITLDKEVPGRRRLSFELTLETANHFIKSHYQKLLVILTMYSGVEQAFATGDFTKSYVGCSLGIWNIGYVMICYGVVDAICSFTFGRLVQYVGHIPFFALAFAVHGGCQVALLLWKPSDESMVPFFLIAAFWGLGDAVIQTQINALYGFLFTKDSEAAFANYRLWESLGFIIAFAIQDKLCTYIKIYICMGFLCVGMFFYAVMEVIHRIAAKKMPDNVRM